MAYDAFISYSHSADGRLAPALQSGLQRFARPWYKRRALRIFRDDTGLAVNPHLWESIRAAMDDARYFVLLASPSAAESPWVNREVDYWLSTKSPDTILPVLTEGDLAWDSAGALDVAASTALPAALIPALVDEPRYLDLRWARDEVQLNLRHTTFRSQIADLAAPMHGIPKEDLEGEDVRLHRHAIRLAWGAALMLAILSVASIALAITTVKKNQDLVRAHGTLAQQQAEIGLNEAKLAGQDTKIQGQNKQIAKQTAQISDQTAKISGQQAKISDQSATISDQTSQITVLSTEASQLSVAATTARAERDQANSDKVAALEAESIAKAGETTAVTAKNSAVGVANSANAQATATDLATAASDPTTLAASPDLSLLLGNAATRVTAAPAPGSVAPAAVPIGATSVDARGALLTAVDTAGTGIHGFLQFTNRDGPQALGRIAVSPDGKWIAAAETSDSIDNGEPGTLGHTRLYVWHAAGGGDPTTARARQIADNLTCVTDLQWTATDELFSVEAEHGCLNAQTYLKIPNTSITFDSSRVRLWNINNSATQRLSWPAPIHPLIGALGVAISGSSPVAMTADHRFALISYTWGELAIDTVGRHFDAQNAVGGNNIIGEKTLSEAGARELGRVGDSDTVWNLHAWNRDCPTGDNVERAIGCFPSLTVPDGFVLPKFTPAGDMLAAFHCNPAVLSDCQPDSVGFFHLPDGALSAVVPVPAGVTGFDAGSTLIAVTTDTGVATANWRSASPTWSTGAVPVDAGCSIGPTVGHGNRLVFLEQSCSDPTDAAVFVADSTGHVLRRLVGTLLASSGDDRFVVTQQLDLRVVPLFGFEIWNFDPSSSPTGFLVDSRTDEEAFVSPHVKSVVAFQFHYAGVVASKAEVWDLTADRISARTLPGSLGARGVAFRNDHQLFGVGSMGAGVAWDTTARSYRVLYADRASATVSAAKRSALRPDMAQRALSAKGKSVQLVDLASGARRLIPALPIDTTTEQIAYITYSRDGRELLVNVERARPANAPALPSCRPSSYTGSIVVDLATLQSTRFDREVALGSSGDGSRLLFRSLDCRTVTVRDARTLAVAGTFRTDGPGGLPPERLSLAGNLYTIDQNGTRVAGTNSTGRALVWGIDGRVLFDRTPGHVEPSSGVDLYGLAFDPDGLHLAVKTTDQRLLIWNLAEPNAPFRSAQLPLDAMARITYSPSEFGLIAVDGTYLIDKTTLRTIGPRLRPPEWNNAFGFDRGAQANRFFEKDGALYLEVERNLDEGAVAWRIDLPALQQRACVLAGRTFTPAEFAQFRVPGSYADAPCADEMRMK